MATVIISDRSEDTTSTLESAYLAIKFGSIYQSINFSDNRRKVANLKRWTGNLDVDSQPSVGMDDHHVSEDLWPQFLKWWKNDFFKIFHNIVHKQNLSKIDATIQDIKRQSIIDWSLTVFYFHLNEFYMHKKHTGQNGGAPKGCQILLRSFETSSR